MPCPAAVRDKIVKLAKQDEWVQTPKQNGDWPTRAMMLMDFKNPQPTGPSIPGRTSRIKRYRHRNPIEPMCGTLNDEQRASPRHDQCPTRYFCQHAFSRQPSYSGYEAEPQDRNRTSSASWASLQNHGAQCRNRSTPRNDKRPSKALSHDKPRDVRALSDDVPNRLHRSARRPA